MPNKKKYYKLDDIGIIGTQEEKTADQIKRDILKTGRIIKAMKAGVYVSPYKTKK
jgi:hypothetical protein